MTNSLTRDAMAARAARDIPSGWFVNLGIGIPTLVASHIAPESGILIHSENGSLGMGPPPPSDAVDPDIIDAGKKPVTILPGGSIFDSAMSFTMVRGQHLDLAILGAFQVSNSGDLANWSLGTPDEIPAVGGAMDIACSARQVWIAMNQFSRDGACRLVDACTYPLTASRVVTRVYTDYAVIDLQKGQFIVTELADGVDFDWLQERSNGLLVRDDS